MTEDQFRNIYLVFFVDNNWYTLAVVHYANTASLWIDFDLQGIHLLIPLVVVCSIDEYLIEYLIESRSVGNVFAGESGLAFLKDPLLLFTGFNRSNVSVGPKKDMLKRSFLLVDFFDCLVGFMFLHSSVNLFIKENSKIIINWLTLVNSF